MAFNGSGVFVRNNGTYTGSSVWQSESGAGNTIDATKFDTHDQDFANGLSNCVTKDGQTNPTANLPMATYKHTGVGDASSRTDYGKVSQIQDGGYIYIGATTGSSNAYVGNASPAISAYAAGQRWIIIPNHTNTTAATLNLNAVGTRALVDSEGNAFTGGELQSGIPASFLDNGTHLRLMSGPARPRVRVHTEEYTAGISVSSTTPTAMMTDSSVQVYKGEHVRVTSVLSLSGTNTSDVWRLSHYFDGSENYGVSDFSVDSTSSAGKSYIYTIVSNFTPSADDTVDIATYWYAETSPSGAAHSKRGRQIIEIFPKA